MMQWIKMLLVAFAAIFAGTIFSAIPPVHDFFTMVNANQTPWLIATVSSAVLGFVLMMGVILDLVMAQDRPLTNEGAEDVSRTVGMVAQPRAWQATSYVWGRAAWQEGSEQFTLQEMKQAWRTGAWRYEPMWRRRFITATGALLLAIGLLGLVFTLGPPPIKAIACAALLYAALMFARGMLERMSRH